MRYGHARGDCAVWFKPFLRPLLALLLGYGLGSIPFGLLLTRAGGAGDVRKIGSGNIGATNVLRTGRKGLAATTLLLDVGKGAAAVLVTEWLWPGTGPMAAVGAFFGHLFPAWLGFRGGKGVATFLGITLALSWPVGLVYAVIWLATLAVSRISSLSGMLAAVSAPVAASFFGDFDLTILFLGLALVVLWKHRDNLSRLLAGTEPRVGKGGNG
jgi:acyl phosphate:glycerol-3-phosphate acyltransferase